MKTTTTAWRRVRPAPRPHFNGEEIGRGEDLPVCARRNSCQVVPALHGTDLRNAVDWRLTTQPNSDEQGDTQPRTSFHHATRVLELSDNARRLATSQGGTHWPALNQPAEERRGGIRPAMRLSNFFTATLRAHPWYNRGVPKPFSTAEVPDHPLTLTEAAESFGLSREAVTSIRTFVSAPARGSSTRRAKGGKAASSRKYSNSKKR